MTAADPCAAGVTPAHARATLTRLEALYPGADCALVHDSSWQLLVATILSAQCTDERVNSVTRELFRRWPGAAELAAVAETEVAALIRPVGCHNAKARSLVGTAAALVARHGGAVPRTLAALTALPGVGRKTANVVLGNAFDIPGMVVDTHVRRLSRRLGWTREDDPERIERDLCRLLPRRRWTRAGHVLIRHGRALCRAPVPLCSQCPLCPRCPRCGVTRSR